MVEKGQLARKFLNTYHSERWPVAQNVLKIDKIAAKAAAGHEASDYCEVVEKNRLFTAGYGISYEINSKDEVTLIYNPNDEGLELEQNGYVMKPGMRAPNFKVFSFASGKKTRLFDAVPHRKDDPPAWLSYTIFVLANDLRETHKTVAKFLDEMSKTSTLLPPVHTVVVTTSTSDQVSQFKGLMDCNKVYIDKLNQAQCHRLYQRKNDKNNTQDNELPQVILVRPDGYIAAIMKNDDGSILSSNVCQYFSNII